MSTNPIWIAGYGGAVAGASPVWVAGSGAAVSGAAEAWIAGYGGTPAAGASKVWIAGYGGTPTGGASPIWIGGVIESGGGGVVHSAQAIAYLARTVGGNEGGNGENVATLIDGLVADGVWAKLDALYILAQQNGTDALLNLVSTNFTATNVLSAPFVAYKGFGPFSAGGSYLNSGFNPTTAISPNFIQNSANIGVWAYAVSAAANTGVDFGATDGSGLNVLVANFNATSSFYTRVNDSGAPSVATPGTKGLFVGDRSSSAQTVPYWNGAAQSAVTSTSSAPANGQFVIGSATTYGSTSDTLSEGHIGGSLGSAGNLALYNRLRTYMTAIGVP